MREIDHIFMAHPVASPMCVYDDTEEEVSLCFSRCIVHGFSLFSIAFKLFTTAMSLCLVFEAVNDNYHSYMDYPCMEKICE